jgi:CDP-glucose 4,6-dehydratase
VLEPLSGYLLLAEQLLGSEGAGYADSWNFGPDRAGDATVEHVASTIMGLMGSKSGIELRPAADSFHETNILRLDSARAGHALNWTPRWTLGEALERTVAWHKAHGAGDRMRDVTLDQIAEYEARARRDSL